MLGACQQSATIRPRQHGQTQSPLFLLFRHHYKWPRTLQHSPMQASADAPDGFDARLRQRAAMASNQDSQTSLEMKPVAVTNNAARAPGTGSIPNTPLAASAISFLLGSLFSLGLLTFFAGGFQQHWWATPQLGFYAAAWSAFHWAEFAVTAGWNRDKCSVDGTSIPDVNYRACLLISHWCSVST